MNYIQFADFAERPGAKELAEIATAEYSPLVSYELMDISLRGGDRSAWLDEDIENADQALARIADAAEQAESIIDGKLAVRGYPLPLSPVPKLVTGWARDIARYLLHKDRIGDERTDPIARAYRDALKMLQDVANGSFSLGATDPIQSSPDMVDVQFSSDEQVFSRKQLNRFH